MSDWSRERERESRHSLTANEMVYLNVIEKPPIYSTFRPCFFAKRPIYFLRWDSSISSIHNRPENNQKQELRDSVRHFKYSFGQFCHFFFPFILCIVFDRRQQKTKINTKIQQLNFSSSTNCHCVDSCSSFSSSFHDRWNRKLFPNEIFKLKPCTSRFAGNQFGF